MKKRLSPVDDYFAVEDNHRERAEIADGLRWIRNMPGGFAGGRDQDFARRQTGRFHQFGFLQAILAELSPPAKAMEYEAVEEGVIASLAIAEGSHDVPVGTVIATLAPLQAAPEPPRAQPVPPIMDRSDVNASPLARRIAAMRGLALAQIAGSGACGRIVKNDLGLPSLLVPASLPQPVLPTITAAPVYDPPAGVPVETVKLSTMRKTIARA